MVKQGQEERPDWDDYFMQIMDVVATRATCGRGRSGCVVTRNNHILSTGYVGSPPGLDHCDEVGHLIIQSTEEYDDSGELHDHCVRTIHAEQNAIVHAAKIGVPLKGSTLYCRMVPCSVCARLIIASGITRVVAEYDYKTSSLSKKMFMQVGIELDILHDNPPEYEK